MLFMGDKSRGIFKSVVQFIKKSMLSFQTDYIKVIDHSFNIKFLDD